MESRWERRYCGDRWYASRMTIIFGLGFDHGFEHGDGGFGHQVTDARLHRGRIMLSQRFRQCALADSLQLVDIVLIHSR
jgi:hypothetical protein